MNAYARIVWILTVLFLHRILVHVVVDYPLTARPAVACVSPVALCSWRPCGCESPWRLSQSLAAASLQPIPRATSIAALLQVIAFDQSAEELLQGVAAGSGELDSVHHGDMPMSHANSTICSDSSGSAASTILLRSIFYSRRRTHSASQLRKHDDFAAGLTGGNFKPPAARSSLSRPWLPGWHSTGPPHAARPARIRHGCQTIGRVAAPCPG